jgi:xanthine dehydrogenase molybdopterin-binding subunit B
MEEVVFTDKGFLFTRGPGTYKIPRCVVCVLVLRSV